jgi:isoleucyl-tRNA synthetase
VLAILHDHLTRLLAPIVPHTAEESWSYLHAQADKPASVHLSEFPRPDSHWDDPERDSRWEELLTLREQILAALEELRKSKRIGSAQEAKVRIASRRPEHWEPDRELLASLCNVSELEITSDAAAASEIVTAARSSHPKCERCWNHRPTVGQSTLYPTLCERCVRVLEELGYRR